MTAFLFVFHTGFFNHPICQGVQHSVAGGSTNYKVITEGDNPLKIEQDDILSFFVFQGVDNGMCKFQGIQKPPLFNLEIVMKQVHPAMISWAGCIKLCKPTRPGAGRIYKYGWHPRALFPKRRHSSPPEQYRFYANPSWKL